MPRSKGSQDIMTAAHILRRGSSPITADPATHLFKVGQSVRLKGGVGLQPQGGEIYRITGTLPPSGDSPQYRIRNDAERHERVTTQHNLELACAPTGRDDDTLSERTFDGTANSDQRTPS
jgi:hypothetical protein